MLNLLSRKYFLVFAALAVIAGGMSIRKLIQVNEPFNGHVVMIEEEELVNDIIFNLGYGGLVHNFKNYILRGEEQYFILAKDKYEILKDDLEKLRSHKQVANRINIENILKAVDEYYKNLFVVKKMAAQGKSAEEIDHKVKVDDSIAYDSLYKIAQALHLKQLITLDATIKRKAQVGKQFGIWMFVLVIILIGGLLLEFRTIFKVSEGTKNLFTNIFDELKIPVMIFSENGGFKYANSAAKVFWNKNFSKDSVIEDKWFDFLLADKMRRDDIFKVENVGTPMTYIKRFEEHNTHTDNIYEMSLNILERDFMSEQRHGIISFTDRTKLIDDNTKSEIHHRVKNNLSLLIGLVEMIKRDTKDNEEAREIMDILTSKIYSISMIYDNEQEISIRGQINVKKYFLKLVEQHRHFNIYLAIDTNLEIADDLLLSPKQMIPLGLIFSEFLVNSIKHANAGNKLVITAKVFFTNNGMTSEFSDNGQTSCEVKEKKSTGLGRKIIEILALQLESTVDISMESGCRLRLFPNSKNDNNTKKVSA